MLHAVGELREHRVGNVARALRHEKHAHALRADELDGLLDLLHEDRRRVAEERVRLVEEEHQLGLFQIARLGQALKQLREHPQKEARVERRVLHQLHAVEHVDHAAAVRVGAHPVIDVERRLAEKEVAALLLKRQQRAQDRRDGLRRDVAVGHHVLRAVLTDVVQHGAQVLEIEEQQPLVIRDAEHDVQDALLRGREAEDAGQKLRPHVAHCRADGVAAGLINVPEGRGIALVGKAAAQTEAVDALFHALAAHAGGADARDVALDVAQEHQHARVGKAFGHHFHRDGLARAARARDQAVAVAHIERKLHARAVRKSHVYLTVFVHRAILRCLIRWQHYRIPCGAAQEKSAAPPRFFLSHQHQHHAVHDARKRAEHDHRPRDDEHLCRHAGDDALGLEVDGGRDDGVGKARDRHERARPREAGDLGDFCLIYA